MVLMLLAQGPHCGNLCTVLYHVKILVQKMVVAGVLEVPRPRGMNPYILGCEVIGETSMQSLLQ